MDVSIVNVTDSKEVARLRKYFWRIASIDEPPEVIYAKAILGNYGTIKCSIDNKTVGIVVYANRFPILHLIGVVARNNLKNLINEFEQMLRDKGYTKITAVSGLSEEAYMKLTGLTKVWSMYEKEL